MGAEASANYGYVGSTGFDNLLTSDFSFNFVPPTLEQVAEMNKIIAEQVVYTPPPPKTQEQLDREWAAAIGLQYGSPEWYENKRQTQLLDDISRSGNSVMAKLLQEGKLLNWATLPEGSNATRWLKYTTSEGYVYGVPVDFADEFASLGYDIYKQNGILTVDNTSNTGVIENTNRNDIVYTAPKGFLPDGTAQEIEDLKRDVGPAAVTPIDYTQYYIVGGLVLVGLYAVFSKKKN